MLQQTQVRRVLELYPEFLKTFPDFPALARARQSEVVVAWKGLGYNNRAVRLHALVRIVTTRHRGMLPDSADELQALPGVGKYTAHALLSSVYRRRTAIVDVNVRRLYSRLFWQMPYWDSMRDEKEIWKLAARILPARKTYEWNQALMDLGALVCTARRPKCLECPLRSRCCSAGRLRVPPRRVMKSEPGRLGVPRRIYRGRVVEALRGKKWLSARRIGETILPGYTAGDAGWLRELLGGLRNDGLIVLYPSGKDDAGRAALA